MSSGPAPPSLSCFPFRTHDCPPPLVLTLKVATYRRSSRALRMPIIVSNLELKVEIEIQLSNYPPALPLTDFD